MEIINTKQAVKLTSEFIEGKYLLTLEIKELVKIKNTLEQISKEMNLLINETSNKALLSLITTHSNIVNINLERVNFVIAKFTSQKILTNK
jgi:dynactin complex subunit